MVKNFISLVITSVCLFIIWPPHSLAQSCSCPGTEWRTIADGDESPLTWKSGAYLVRENQPKAPEICYYRSVKNHSNQEVRDVEWRIAGYFRKIIPANQERSQCVYFTDSVRDETVSGQLYYGTSSSGYETSVVSPKNGWDQSMSDSLFAISQFGPIDANTFVESAPSLISVVDLDVPLDDGSISEAKIIVASDLSFVENMAILRYRFENRSTAQLAVFVDIATDEELLKQYSISYDKPLSLLPEGISYIDARVTGPLVAHPATLVVTDQTGEVMARAVVGAYGAYKGVVQVEPVRYWNR